MELVIPSRSMDFDFHGGARPSPANLSSPSTPKGFGKFFFSSAPTSPTRMSQFYQEFDELLINNRSQKTITEEATKSSTEAAAAAREEDEFAFDFSADSEKASLSADELFDGGKIRPLKPPPKSPRSSIAPGKFLISAFSPRRKKNQKNQERERGRDRTPAALQGSSSGRRSGATRSLSPLRVSEFPWEEEQQQQNNKHPLISASKQQPAAEAATLSSSSSKGSGRRWRLRDFLLFRSASEGRATDKDPFRKYSAFRKQEDFQNANFKSGEGSGSWRRRGQVSAHELHYTVNRAVSEDLRKKTFLPYKQGILGRLAFNPAVHALANGFGSLSRS